MPLPAGMRDRRVVVEKRTVTESVTGQQLEEWLPWRPVWMHKRDLSAAERVRGNQLVAERTTTWASPYIQELDGTNYRLNYEGTIYNIRGLREIDRRAWLEIFTEAVHV